MRESWNTQVSPYLLFGGLGIFLLAGAATGRFGFGEGLDESDILGISSDGLCRVDEVGAGCR